jgi:hypothetical protein
MDEIQLHVVLQKCLWLGGAVIVSALLWALLIKIIL